MDERTKLSKGLVKGSEVEIFCPKCANSGRGQVRLVVKENRTTHTQFLACPNWPECDHAQPITETLKMVAQGQPTLL